MEVNEGGRPRGWTKKSRGLAYSQGELPSIEKRPNRKSGDLGTKLGKLGISVAAAASQRHPFESRSKQSNSCATTKAALGRYPPLFVTADLFGRKRTFYTHTPKYLTVVRKKNRDLFSPITSYLVVFPFTPRLCTLVAMPDNKG